MPDNIDYTLPEVEKAMIPWRRVRDCIDGQDAIKEQGTKYLPAIQAWDKSNANLARNADYAERAVFYGVTKRTLKGMVGQVVSKPAVLTVPELLDFMLEDVDGGAVSIDQQARQALSDTLAVGRCGLMTDYPQLEPGTTATRQDLLDGRIRPSIQYYFAEQIINWRVEMVNGLRKLTLVVLHESYIKKDDGFKKEDDRQWRVLRLVDNIYIQQVWRKSESGRFYIHQASIPKDSKGKEFDEILFTVVGSDNNDAGLDDAPLLDMANLNIAHYRNSADYEESSFIVGQPTPVLSGLTKDWVSEVWGDKDLFPQGVALGSRAAIPLPEGGNATLLQASENMVAMEAMKHKEEQMKALGARLVEPKTGERTLGEAQMNAGEEASVLMSAAKNVSAGYTKCLEWAAKFVGAVIPEKTNNEDTEKFGYWLNTDFEISRMTTDQRRQLLTEWQGGAISYTEYRAILRRSGIATQTDEDAKEEIDKQTEKDMETQSALLGNRFNNEDEDNEDEDA
jgi:hypothetical protein